MNCYSHQDRVAVGVCKNCMKAVCVECAQDTGNGLACGPECTSQIAAHTRLMNFRRRIFGIGASGKRVSIFTKFLALFSALNLVFFLYDLLLFNRFDMVFLGLSLAMGIATIMFYRREMQA